MTPDPVFVHLIERKTTGANIHRMRNLLETYTLACYANNDVLADTARLDIFKTLIADRSMQRGLWRGC
jgi:hypothetical protein